VIAAYGPTRSAEFDAQNCARSKAVLASCWRRYGGWQDDPDSDILASCIESGRFPASPEASRRSAQFSLWLPYLVDTRTWESEMENFFRTRGDLLACIVLHGEQLRKLRRDDAEGPELELQSRIGPQSHSRYRVWSQTMTQSRAISTALPT